MSPEWSVFILVFIVVVLAYTSIYPKLAGNNFTKVSMCDIVVSTFVMSAVGFKYWGTGQVFNFFSIDLNWFMYTLVIFALIEGPAVFLYAKKHNMKF